MIPSSVKNELDQVIGKGENPYAVFDFDRTCLWDNDCEEILQFYLCEQGLIKNPCLFQEAGEVINAEYHRKAFHHYFELPHTTSGRYKFTKGFFVGFKEDELLGLMDEALKKAPRKKTKVEFWGRNLEKGFVLHPFVSEVLDYLETQNVRNFIVSASVEPLLLKAGKELLEGRSIAQFIGARMKKDPSGRFINEYEPPCAMIEGKYQVVRQRIDPLKNPILGIGDNINDLPMIEICDIKVVVDQGNKMAEKARNSGWLLV